MRILLAPDSFKESMTSIEAIEAMEKGIKKAIDNVEIIKVPMADGGEGITEALVTATNGKFIKVKVKDPLERSIISSFGILGDGKTAIIELAKASGLELLNKEERNPLITNTYGLGQLLKEALNYNVDNIIIGLGGSATNDCGMGMLEALGVNFYNKEGNLLKSSGENLEKINFIDLTSIDKRVFNVSIEVACDVNNPLYGEKGATYVFSKQKGADKKMMEILERGVINFNRVVKENLNFNMNSLAGAGAAGGTAGAIAAFLKGRLVAGGELVIKYTELEEKIKKADIIFTGEGSMDYQSKFGKTPVAVARLGKKYNKPVIAFVGKIGEGTEELYKEGITSVISIINEVTSLDKVLEKGKENLEKTVENIVRLLENK